MSNLHFILDTISLVNIAGTRPEDVFWAGIAAKSLRKSHIALSQ
ncbi:hypothetical protein [Flavobacterium sp. DSP2-3-1]